MKLRDLSKSERTWMVVGGVIALLGLLMLLARYSDWWMRALGYSARLLGYLMPLALIAAGVLVAYGVATHRFDGLLSRLSASGGPLRRSATDKRFGGVCGGIAQYFGINSTSVRIIIVIIGVVSPLFTLIAYTALMLVLPSE